MRWKRVWPLVALVVWSVGCAEGLRGSALVLQARIKAEEAKNNPPPVEEVTTGEDGSNSTISTTTSKPKPQLTGNPQKDYIYDPNLPRELKGHDLSSYPFYNAMPPDIEFECDGLHDGFYASVPHHCQVYHHCLFGTRYDFLCANYTAFDQKTFICHFVSEVDCKNSPKYYQRNEALYKAVTSTTKATTTTTTTTTTTVAPPSGGGASGGGGGRRGGGGAPGRRRRIQHRRRRPIYEYYYDDEEYDDQDYYEDDLPPPRKSNRKHRPPQGGQKSKDEEETVEPKGQGAEATGAGTGSLGSVFSKPRAPPKIRRPVPINERAKYEYTTSPGLQAGPSTPAQTQPPPPQRHQQQPQSSEEEEPEEDDYYDDEEADYDDEPPKKPKKEYELMPGRDKAGNRRRGGQHVRKRPPPPRYSEEDYFEEEEEEQRPKIRKGPNTRRGGPSEEDYPRNRNRGHRKGYRDDEDDPMPHERYSVRGGGGGRKRYHSDLDKPRGGRRPDRRPYYDDEDEDYEYYDDEEEFDNHKNSRNRNRQEDKRPVQPSRNKFRSRNEEEKPRTTTSTTTSTTPRYEKPQRLASKHKIQDNRESEEYYDDYDEQEVSTSGGRGRFDNEEVSTNGYRGRYDKEEISTSGGRGRFDKEEVSTSGNRGRYDKEDNRASTTPRDTLTKYTFRSRQESSSTAQPTTSTATTSTTTATTTTPEPLKTLRFKMPVKMKAIYRNNAPFSQESHEKTTSSKELDSSAEVSQKPVAQEVESTTTKSATPVRQMFSRRPLRPQTTTTEQQDKEEAEERPQPVSQQSGSWYKAGGAFNARRPASELPTSTPQTLVVRRPIKIVVDQTRKSPSDFQSKPNYSRLELPRGFVNGRRPPSVPTVENDPSEERQAVPAGLNYRNPFKPAEHDEDEESEYAVRPKTSSVDQGPNFRRPFKTKEPEAAYGPREDSEEERSPVSVKRLSLKPVKEENVEPTAIPPPPPEENDKPSVEDIPTGPAREPTGYNKPDQGLPVRTFAFFNTRPKRPQTDNFPQQPPKQIELTAPGPSGPAEGSTLRPHLNIQQNSFQEGFRGLADLPEEEYDVTLNDALQPSTLHPTQSLLQPFQPRIKTRGFQSAVAHPQYQRGAASYLVPSATQQFYSKVRQEGPRDSLPQGSIVDAREYEAIVVPAPRFDQPRFKQRTRPREWYW